MLAVSLNLINGFTGQFSIGHAGFMAVGAYASAYFTVTFGDRDPRRRCAFLPEFARRRRRAPDRRSSIGGAARRGRGLPRRPAVAAPARRLPRDRDARLRRDHPRRHPEHRRGRRRARLPGHPEARELLLDLPLRGADDPRRLTASCTPRSAGRWSRSARTRSPPRRWASTRRATRSSRSSCRSALRRRRGRAVRPLPHVPPPELVHVPQVASRSSS